MDQAGVLHVAGAPTFSRYEFGVRLLHLHGLDHSPIIPVFSRESGLHCPLDCSRARPPMHAPAGRG